MNSSQLVSNVRLLRPMRSRGIAKRVLQGVFVLGLACASWEGALAQPVVAAHPAVSQSQAVAVELTQYKVVKNAKGEEQLVSAATVKPGDVIEYRVTYTNKSGKAVTGLIGKLPIPEGLEYLPRSAKPGADLVKAAASDGVFAAEPLMRKLSDGKSKPLPYNEYRALRWTLGRLPAGGVTAISARAKVETVAPVAVAGQPVAKP